MRTRENARELLNSAFKNITTIMKISEKDFKDATLKAGKVLYTASEENYIFLVECILENKPCDVSMRVLNFTEDFYTVEAYIELEGELVKKKLSAKHIILALMKCDYVFVSQLALLTRLNFPVNILFEERGCDYKLKENITLGVLRQIHYTLFQDVEIVDLLVTYNEKQLEVLLNARRCNIDFEIFATPQYSADALEVLCRAKQFNVDLYKYTNPSMSILEIRRIESQLKGN